MLLPDNTSLEVVALTNEHGHVTATLSLVMPDKSTVQAWLDFTPKMEITSGAITLIKTAETPILEK